MVHHAGPWGWGCYSCLPATCLTSADATFRRVIGCSEGARFECRRRFEYLRKKDFPRADAISESPPCELWKHRSVIFRGCMRLRQASLTRASMPESTSKSAGRPTGVAVGKPMLVGGVYPGAHP